MSKKSVLILAMSCNGETNKESVRNWLPLWGNACDKYDNMEWLAYTGSAGEPNSIDWSTHLVRVNTGDDVPATFNKTAECFRYLKEIGVLEKYDYIFRTNDSTWINVDLVEMFVNSLPDNDPHIYAGSILVDYNAKPIKYAPMAQGNGILIRREYTEYLTPIMFEYYKRKYRFNEPDACDDVVMSQCFNCIFLEKHINPWLMFKSFGRFAVCMKDSSNPYGDPNIEGSSRDNINHVIMIVCKNFMKRHGGYQDETDKELQQWVKQAFDDCQAEPSLDLVNKRIQENKVYLRIPELCDITVSKGIASAVLMLNPIFSRTFGKWMSN